MSISAVSKVKELDYQLPVSKLNEAPAVNPTKSPRSFKTDSLKADEPPKGDINQAVDQNIDFSSEAEKSEKSPLKKGLEKFTALTGGGIFQELVIKIPFDFQGAANGPNAGIPARYSLSFRDLSGHPESTSQVFLNKVSPGVKPLKSWMDWKGLRLDYGPNVRTGGETNWHWNQKSAFDSFGKVDHGIPSKLSVTVGKASTYMKPVARAALVLGATIDAVSIGNEISKSIKSGEWSNTGIEVGRVAGGWAGSYGAANILGMAGTVVGSKISPGIGTAIGGAVGGFAGGVLGYIGGSALGEATGKAVFKSEK